MNMVQYLIASSSGLHLAINVWVLLYIQYIHMCIHAFFSPSPRGYPALWVTVDWMKVLLSLLSRLTPLILHHSAPRSREKTNITVSELRTGVNYVDLRVAHGQPGS